MRISDWSSDVCSSDLAAAEQDGEVHDRNSRRAAGGDVAERQRHALQRGHAEDCDQHPLGLAAAVELAGEQGSYADQGEHHRVQWRDQPLMALGDQLLAIAPVALVRSEEHTSELQSLMRISYAVFFLKKKT